jgi:hypothetical protein
MPKIKMPGGAQQPQDQQQLPPSPPPSPIGPPPNAMLPIPPAPLPPAPGNIDTSTLPQSPINWKGLMEQTLKKHGVRSTPNGGTEKIPDKELPMDVSTLAQSMYTPSMMTMPQVKPLTAQSAQQGQAPVMSTQTGNWGNPNNNPNNKKT